MERPVSGGKRRREFGERSAIAAAETAVPYRSLRALRVRRLAGATGLEPATSGVTGRRSNQLSYAPAKGKKGRPNRLAAEERWVY
jgi:hypothetical protein